MTPAVRLGVDTIDPNNKTPRALAGDNTSYYRFSGEVSLWAPLTEISGTPHRIYLQLSLLQRAQPFRNSKKWQLR